jgi:hypothetical protein
MAAFLLSILERTRKSDRTAARFVETSNPPHQRRDGMAALAAYTLRQSARRQAALSPQGHCKSAIGRLG